MLLLEVGLSVGLLLLAVELVVPTRPLARVGLGTLAAGIAVLVVGSARPVLVAGAAGALGVLTSLTAELLAVAGDAQRLALLGGRRRRI